MAQITVTADRLECSARHDIYYYCVAHAMVVVRTVHNKPGSIAWVRCIRVSQLVSKEDACRYAREFHAQWVHAQEEDERILQDVKERYRASVWGTVMIGPRWWCKPLYDSETNTEEAVQLPLFAHLNY